MPASPETQTELSSTQLAYLYMVFQFSSADPSVCLRKAKKNFVVCPRIIRTCDLRLRLLLLHGVWGLRELRNPVNYFRFPRSFIPDYYFIHVGLDFSAFSRWMVNNVFPAQRKNLQGNHSLLVCFSYFSSQPSSFNIWCVQVQFKAVSEHSNCRYIHHPRVLMRFNISSGSEYNFRNVFRPSGHLTPSQLAFFNQITSNRRLPLTYSRWEISPAAAPPPPRADTQKTKSQLMEARAKNINLSPIRKSKERKN